MTVATFDQPCLIESLERLTDSELDNLDFGVIAMDSSCMARRYNALESKMSGLTPETVLGANVFTNVAPCMNNFMIAQRFEDSLTSGTDLDDTIDYVLTLRMRPSRVKLRLITSTAAKLRYIAIKRVP